MKEFFVDLWDLYKHSWDFFRDHWKGYLILFAVVEGIVIGVFYWWSQKPLKDLTTPKEDEEWNQEFY